MKYIHPGMKACMTGGDSAIVTDVLLDPHDGAERYLVVNVDGFFQPDVVVPISAVWCVDEQVHLALSSHDTGTLPRFTPVRYCRDMGLCSRGAVQRGAGWHHYATESP